MMHIARWKVGLVLGALLLGLLFSLPNVLPERARASLPGFVPSKAMNLGLDLQGGSHLLLEVDTEALKRERINDLLEDVRRALREDRVVFTGLSKQGQGVTVRIERPEQMAVATAALNSINAIDPQTGQREMVVSSGADQRLTIAYAPEALDREAAKAVDQSIEIIRRRVDALGTREPTIVRQGENRIVVQVPGESDPQRLKNVIGQTAKLTFQMVDDSVTGEEVAAGRIPPGAEVLPSDDGISPATVVKTRVLVSGEMLLDARAATDPTTNQPVVTFRFDSQGARNFGRATTQNVGKRFAIVLDGRVISAPVINEPILGGSGQIQGNFTIATASDLAVLLRAGALPAPLTVEEERSVGAELGADAVEAGKIATMLAFLLVVGFMVIAYGWLFGGIAVLAMLLNGLLVVGAMSMIQATLTLPGVAGLILTLAMAVDANVLIYERMRDEQRAGRSPIASADAGFSRAIVTILDANITTLAAAAILFYFGSGPVRGFAWTLSIGVITSVFTAVMVTQVLTAWWLRLAKPKKLPIA